MKRFAYVACFLFAVVVFAQAQSYKITSLTIKPDRPSRYINHITINGENISSTPISGEFDPGWNRCIPCNSGTQVPLSIVRTTTQGIGPIGVRGITNLVIDGTTYNFAVGWLEMIYITSPVSLYKHDTRRNLRFARNADTEFVRLRLWKSENEFPNAVPIVDQTMQMNCTAYLKVKRFNRNIFIFDFETQEYEWQCQLQ